MGLEVNQYMDKTLRMKSMASYLTMRRESWQWPIQVFEMPTLLNSSSL